MFERGEKRKSLPSPLNRQEWWNEHCTYCQKKLGFQFAGLTLSKCFLGISFLIFWIGIWICHAYFPELSSWAIFVKALYKMMCACEVSLGCKEAGLCHERQVIFIALDGECVGSQLFCAYSHGRLLTSPWYLTFYLVLYFQNTQVTEAWNKVAHSFNCTPIEGETSYKQD